MSQRERPSAGPDRTAERVTDLIARFKGIARGRDLDRSRWLTELGIDSLSALELRERLERVLKVHIPDREWAAFRSVNELIGFIDACRPPAGDPGRERDSGEQTPGVRAVPPGPQGVTLTTSSAFYQDIELGMPLTGLNNLCEGPLLQLLGDLRWRHLSALCGLPSRQIADSEGQRLYPTFFYVELAFPEGRPMASFEENDRLRLRCGLERFGRSMLDGLTYLLPPDTPQTDTPPFAGIEDALAAGVPAARLSNVFVMQFAGAEWLKKSRPADPGFERIPESTVAPDSYTAAKQADKDGHFSRPGKTYVAMTPGPVKSEYRLVPDRDLNGAGLVYFANYPVFLDICERAVLQSASLALSDELINRRTLVRRRSAYLNNASARDVLDIEVEPWIENPFLAGHPSPETARIRLFVNFRMYRRSDGRLMMVSTAKKTVYGRTMKEVPFFAELAATG